MIILWLIIISALLMIILGAGLIFMYLEAHRDRIIKHFVAIDHLPHAFHHFRIFFISDIHRREITSDLLNAIKEKPDLVIIGGDLTENGVPFERVEENVKKLTSLGPVIFVWGNHDIQVDREKFLEILKKHGVKIVENDTYVVSSQSSHLNLVCVHDATNELDDLDRAIMMKKAGPIILISHNPIIKNQIKEDDNISLIVSGHTHGGQIRLLGWGPREKGGVKKVLSSTLIISNGYGTTRLPLRFGAPPDTLFLELVHNLCKLV
ncbi:putative MPP superfamily phosphohydrolase [Scopulibacillus darangshiensis]|uniref:Putative MPP superfamily phosphohydrolase n=1 Tax=Scopulibacillus darangshiensis TaxID=442528 RepID=A0A4R2PC65_9BACL|nr:metallophosphoesterase [Scopulibacillus darangshiensis]TCP31671.1 putative MPP superfamily phosphohydrolase [Scopulibacillus darangshiensis]